MCTLCMYVCVCGCTCTFPLIDLSLVRVSTNGVGDSVSAPTPACKVNLLLKFCCFFCTHTRCLSSACDRLSCGRLRLLSFAFGCLNFVWGRRTLIYSTLSVKSTIVCCRCCSNCVASTPRFLTLIAILLFFLSEFSFAERLRR